VDILEKSSFFCTVDHVNCLLSNSAKVNEQLHSETASKKGFICCFAHFEEELYPSVFPLPRQHVGVSFNNHDVDQVESLYIYVSYAEGDLLFHYACCLNLIQVQISDPKWLLGLSCKSPVYPGAAVHLRSTQKKFSKSYGLSMAIEP